MRCPNCGRQVPPDQKFCRFCGGSLEAVARMPPAHPTTSEADEQGAKVTNRMPARRMSRALFWGLVVIGLGVTLLANSQGSELVEWLGIPILLAGVGLAIYGAFSPRRAKALPPGRSSQPKSLDQPEVGPRLLHEDRSEPAPSVTERTTELLGVEKLRGSKETDQRDARG